MEPLTHHIRAFRGLLDEELPDSCIRQKSPIDYRPCFSIRAPLDLFLYVPVNGIYAAAWPNRSIEWRQQSKEYSQACSKMHGKTCEIAFLL